MFRLSSSETSNIFEFFFKPLVLFHEVCELARPKAFELCSYKVTHHPGSCSTGPFVTKIAKFQTSSKLCSGSHRPMHCMCIPHEDLIIYCSCQVARVTGTAGSGVSLPMALQDCSEVTYPLGAVGAGHLLIKIQLLANLFTCNLNRILFVHIEGNYPLLSITYIAAILMTSENEKKHACVTVKM